MQPKELFSLKKRVISIFEEDVSYRMEKILA
jgi:hypothetical protein